MEIRHLTLPDQSATEAFAARLATLLQPGDTILLSGPIGAGKTTLARALIRAAIGNPSEDVPSPTFTLIQTYPTPLGDIWHADLYRLGHPSEALELGLDDAFDTAICLVEWPDRLGDLAPAGALNIALTADADGHSALISGSRPWPARLEAILD